MISIKKKSSYTELLIILVIVNAFGFPGNYTDLLGNQFETAIEYGFFLVELLLLLRYSGRRQFSVKKRHVSIILFVGIVFAESMIVTNYPTLQLISCFRLCVTIAFALFLVEKISVERILELFYKAQVIFLVLTAIYVVLDPAGAFQDTTLVAHAFTGLFTTKNSCASELTCGIILTSVLLKICIDKGERIEKNKIVMLIIQSVLLIGCLATGPVLCAIIPAVYIFFFSKKRINPAMFMWVVSIGFLVVSLSVLPAFENILSFLGKDITLTGRTDMWNQVIEVMTNTHTLTGFGYAMFWRDPSAYSLIHAGFNQYSFLGNMTSGAHNMIMDLWLNIGLLGLVFLLFMCFSAMRRYKELDGVQYCLVMAFIMYFTLHGLSERAFAPFSYSTLLFFVSTGIGTNIYNKPNLEVV